MQSGVASGRHETCRLGQASGKIRETMNHFYVLRSEKDGKLYKGSTSNLTKRLLDHKMGRVFATKSRRPLILIYSESFTTYDEALKREKYSKTLRGGKKLKKLFDNL